MSTSEDHEGLADELEQETDALQRESDKLGQDIDDARTDWEAKRNDPSVPGAPAPEGDGHSDEDAEPRGAEKSDAESE